MASNKDLVENLLPTLIQCFGTILLGFTFGQTKILRNKSAQGLCIFLQYLSLPSLIFISLATISFENVKWSFIASILVAKTLVFVLVALLTMALTSPVHIGKSGIYAIAATQSNDLALGYPLMVSLYKACHQDYPLMLYIVVPIQLLLLNPIGFFMMETYRQMNDPTYRQERKVVVILKGIVRNPVVMMTVLGLIWNVSFAHRDIPPMIYKLLDALGSVFSTIALFLLGHEMSSEGSATRRRFSLSPALIVLAKILFLPLLLQKIAVNMLQGITDDEIHSLSSFGFLYATLPIAPSVFIFAKHYKIGVDVITSTTVYSTLFSAPFTFTSAMMIALNQDGFPDFKYHLTKTISYTGAVNLFCCILLAFIFIKKRHWRNIYYIGVIYVITAQIIMAIGATLMFFHIENDSPMFYAGFILQAVGLYATYIYAVFMAVLFFILHWKSLCFVLRYQTQIKAYGFIIPLIISIILASSLLKTRDNSSSYFELGKVEYIANIAVSATTLLTTVILLIMGHRCMNNSVNESEGRDRQGSSGELNVQIDECQSLIKRSISCGTSSCCCQVKYRLNEANTSDYRSPSACNVITDIESSDEGCRHSYLVQCNSEQGCSKQQRLQCRNNIENYQNELINHDIKNLENFNQYKRCMVLLVSLCCCMLVTLSESLSKIEIDTETGAFIELQFISVVLKNGQGIICCCLFCIDLLSSRISCQRRR